jgi:polygalacturonase
LSAFSWAGLRFRPFIEWHASYHPVVRFLSVVSFALLFVASLSAKSAQAKVCDPRTFGARADGVTFDTAAIQQAIEACAPTGGTIRLTQGTYLSAPLVLRSNITLQLDPGAILLASNKPADFPANTLTREHSAQPFLSATGASNITIHGGGVIDGNGAWWWAECHRRHDAHDTTPLHKPHVLVFDHCNHILVENITVQNGPSWQVVPYDSDFVTFRNMKVVSPADSPNTDGIDPFSSHHVLIDHVTIDTGDDNVAIKSGQPNSQGPDAPSTDITITDCTFLAGRGLSIGSETAGGVQHVRAERIHFHGTFHGVRIKSNRDRGADISDIDLRDLDMTDVVTPISIVEYYPSAPKNRASLPLTRLTPRFHDIRITHLRATGAKDAGQIVGLPESPIQALRLSDVSITAKTGLSVTDASVTLHDVRIDSAYGAPILKFDGALIQ